MTSKSLQDLPDELLLRICDSFDPWVDLDDWTLVRLSRTSSRLRGVLLPYVYKNVCIQRPGSSMRTEPATIIVSFKRLKNFIDAISASPTRLKHVRHVRINWTPDGPEGPPPPTSPSKTHKDKKLEDKLARKGPVEDSSELGYISKLIRLLNDQGENRPWIHLAADFKQKRDEFGDWILTLKDLEPSHTFEVILPPRPKDWQVFALYRKQGLQQLVLSNLESLFSVRREAEAVVDEGALVPILTLKVIERVDWVMKTVLTRPKALKALQIEFQPDINGRFAGLTQHTDPSSWGPLFDLQKKSLEEIFWTTIGQHLGQTELNTLQSLRDFPNLKRVGLPSYFFFHFKEDVGDSHTADQHAPSLSKILPESLQELQLEIDPNEQTLEWNEDVDDESTPITDTAIEFLEWLSDVPANKAAALPNLRKLVVWQRNARAPPFGPPPAFEQVQKFAQACKDRGIDYSYCVQEQPPLFGVFG